MKLVQRLHDKMQEESTISKKEAPTAAVCSLVTFHHPHLIYIFLLEFLGVDELIQQSFPQSHSNETFCRYITCNMNDSNSVSYIFSVSYICKCAKVVVPYKNTCIARPIQANSFLLLRSIVLIMCIWI